MKILSRICCISMLLLSSVLTAAEAPTPRGRMKVLSGSSYRLPRLVEQLRKTRQARSVTPFASIDFSSQFFFIPAAGSLQGGGGTFFRSDVTLVNFDTVDQAVAIFWLGRDAGDPEPPGFTMTLPPNGDPLTIVDFVNSGLGLSGLGALAVFAIDSAGEPDIDSSIDGTSRIWTPQPGSNGTVSQGFRAVDWISLYLEDDAIALGLRHDAGFRTNVGIAHVDEVPRTFQVSLKGERFSAEMTVTVPASSLTQVAVPPGDYGALDIVFRPPADAPELIWAAYGTSVDNVTGDSWASMAAAILAPDEIFKR